ncbi:transmembrane protein, putative [Medicago truncatula]|uniref:Transmembrane protein, putative n=1 Tax=Medicago truncatula TaxID=3880 RepID=A0A072UFE4_MEDTR|nr:transmembrane protein, putative [Medicago truncatula]
MAWRHLDDISVMRGSDLGKNMFRWFQFFLGALGLPLHLLEEVVLKWDWARPNDLS